MTTSDAAREIKREMQESPDIPSVPGIVLGCALSLIAATVCVIGLTDAGDEADNVSVFLVGGLVAAGASLVIGAISLERRRRGLYLASRQIACLRDAMGRWQRAEQEKRRPSDAAAHEYEAEGIEAPVKLLARATSLSDQLVAAGAYGPARELDPVIAQLALLANEKNPCCP